MNIRKIKHAIAMLDILGDILTQASEGIDDEEIKKCLLYMVIVQMNLENLIENNEV